MDSATLPADDHTTTAKPRSLLRPLTKNPVYFILIVGGVLLVLFGLGIGISSPSVDTPPPTTPENVVNPSKVPEVLVSKSKTFIRSTLQFVVRNKMAIGFGAALFVVLATVAVALAVMFWPSAVTSIDPEIKPIEPEFDVNRDVLVDKEESYTGIIGGVVVGVLSIVAICGLILARRNGKLDCLPGRLLRPTPAVHNLTNPELILKPNPESQEMPNPDLSKLHVPKLKPEKPKTAKELLVEKVIELRALYDGLEAHDETEGDTNTAVVMIQDIQFKTYRVSNDLLIYKFVAERLLPETLFLLFNNGVPAYHYRVQILDKDYLNSIKEVDAQKIIDEVKWDETTWIVHTVGAKDALLV